MQNSNVSRVDVLAAPGGAAETPHSGGADLPDHDTLQWARQGDRDALGTLLAAARPRLYAVALRMVRDRDIAEDIVQEALLKVWRHVGAFEGRAALSTWLHRIVVNTAVDHLRSRRTSVETNATIGEGGEGERRGVEAVDGRTPEDLLARAELGWVLRRAMSRLGPLHSQVLALRELDGESYQAIADLAGCPIGTVMSRLHHARHRLAETLESECPELTALAA